MAVPGKAYERRIAVNANYHHLEKWNKEEGLGWDEDELLFAAYWNYNQFGFGKVSLTEYLAWKEWKNRPRPMRLYSVNVKLWYKLLNFIFERDNYTCTYCGQVGGKLEGDHIVPISKGGTNDVENLVTSCRKCNRQKKDKSVEEFLEWRKEKTISNG